jgi:N-methylhydantoinase A
VNAAIAQEIHYVCAEKGINVQNFALIAYGGAGPLHAAHIAQELGMKKVLIPFWPGLLCALGVLATEPKADFAVTRVITLNDPSAARPIEHLLAELERRSRLWLEEQNIPSRAAHYSYSLDMRYSGQNYELPVAIVDGPIDVASLIERFHLRHEQAYGYRSKRGAVQCVQARLTLSLEVDHPPLLQRHAARDKVPRVKERREVYIGREHGFVCCPVYERASIGAGTAFAGSAVIEQMDTTTLVLPNQHALTDSFGNLVLEWF